MKTARRAHPVLDEEDIDARFSLAYAYDELGERELSLYH